MNVYHDDEDQDVAIDTTLGGLEERRPLTLLQIPGDSPRSGDFSNSSSVSDLGSPIYERRSRQYIVSSIRNFQYPSLINCFNSC